MKTKVIIENGETEIVLTPENIFERDLLQKINSGRQRFNIHTDIEADYVYGVSQNHKIILNIKEEK